MEVKKNPVYRLDNYSMVFFEVGLIIALFVTYLVLESRSSPRIDTDLISTQTIFVDEVDIPVTERRQEKILMNKLPPPPVTQIMIVADDTELEQELEIETTEIDEDYEVDIKDYTPKEVEEVEVEEEEVFNFQVVESQAIYPGCEQFEGDNNQLYMCFQQNIMKHVQKNFRYPEAAREMGIQGRVIVKFVIGKDGTIGNVEVLRGIDRHLDEEAVRIVKLIPRMQPASQRGKNVPVSFMLPITFKLQ